jgi:hypothetical protein
MYKELDKWKTGKKIDTIGVLPDKQEVTIKLNEYSAPLGELMEDFINHTRKPKWRRNYYHNHLARIYKEMLNQIGVIRHGL